MIDIVTDYVAIGVGAAQATTARLLGAGRAGVERLAATPLPSLPGAGGGTDLAGLVGRGRSTVAGFAGDARSAAARLVGRDNQ